jgi:reactive chlorine resistance protein C
MINLNTVTRAQGVAAVIARYGLVLCFVFIGLAKFTPEEARGIQPLIAHSPFMSWMYSVRSVQRVSDIIGIVELVIGTLLIVGTWSTWSSLIGGLFSAITFLLTISFLFSTPGAIVTGRGFPALGAAGQFLIKDLVLLGASLNIAASSWRKILLTMIISEASTNSGQLSSMVASKLK